MARLFPWEIPGFGGPLHLFSEPTARGSDFRHREVSPLEPGPNRFVVIGGREPAQVDQALAATGPELSPALAGLEQAEPDES